MPPSQPSALHVARGHYQQLVETAEGNRRYLDQLGNASLTILAGRSGDSIADPGRFHQAANPNANPHEGINQHWHWAARYLKAIREPTFNNAHRALIEISRQTAGPNAEHSREDSALFTAAARALIIRTQLPQEHTGDIPPNVAHDIVDFAAAIVRCSNDNSFPQHILEPLITTALNVAVSNLSQFLDDSTAASTIQHSPDLSGWTVFATRAYTHIQRANTIALCATHHRLVENDHPDVAALRAINESHLAEWRRIHLRHCAFDAIPSDVVRYISTPPQLTAYHVIQLAKAAREIIAMHQNAVPNPETDHLQVWVDHPDIDRVTDDRQRQLAEELDALIRARDSWMEVVTGINEEEYEDGKGFEELQQYHHWSMTHYCRIIIAASLVELPELAVQRNAVILAAAGAINHQCRDELDSYLRHAPRGEHLDRQARQRLHHASAIVRAVPNSVLDHVAQADILQDDLARERVIGAQPA